MGEHFRVRFKDDVRSFLRSICVTNISFASGNVRRRTQDVRGDCRVLGLLRGSIGVVEGGRGCNRACC